jgi:hypothetical protein
MRSLPSLINSLSSSDAQRGYRHAIDEFVDWYCSEPRLSLRVRQKKSWVDSGSGSLPSE